MRIDTELLIDKYKQNIYAISYGICKNRDDAEDVMQETFIKYHLSNKQFDSEEHIRAWLFRVAINKSKNIRLSFWNRKRIDIEDIYEKDEQNSENKELLEKILKLPEKYRIVIHLFYYEDYSIKEISKILHISESNVGVRLNRARKQLRQSLEEEDE